jgi:hypothetical protein
MSSTNTDSLYSDEDDDMESSVEESIVNLENLEYIHDIQTLEKLTSQNINVIFDADCVRKRSNLSKSSAEYKLDSVSFNPQKLLQSIPTDSPKLNALLSKIERLDENDMKKHGKLFKHFIFSDIKSGSFGAKLIASALIAKGFKLGYSARRKGETGPIAEQPTVGGAKPKLYEKIELLTDEELATNPSNNFYLLSSVGVYDQPISVKNKKEILKKMNQRPENIHGELARIIVMDSGFKEGIDLFDIKYIHIFEPQITSADQKQVIGRGTRTCGQKGLTFHPTRGWPLHVFIYDIDIPESIRKYMANSSTAFDLYLKALNIDVRLIEFTHDLERLSIYGSVDYELNQNIHNFSIRNITSISNKVSPMSSVTAPGASSSISPMSSVTAPGASSSISPMSSETAPGANSSISPMSSVTAPGANSSISPMSSVTAPGASSPISPMSSETAPGASSSISPMSTETAPGASSSISPMSSETTVVPESTNTEEVNSLSTLGGSLSIFNIEVTDVHKRMNHEELRKYIRENFGEYSWDDVKMENLCKGGASHATRYTPTQDFIRHYFTPENPVKGMLLFHSVGTGKTCCAIAAATTSFVPKGYTILWVTRTTLKNDIWKNMFEQICNEQIKEEIKKGVILPNEHAKRMRMLSKEWSIRPMSYKQFSNLVSKQNNFYKSIVKKNGEADPLRKTLLIIDEAHKLYGGGDLSSLERPDMNALKQSIQQSFQLSGVDSVKLLLMTATPITENPMELIKLINLCKPTDEQMPELFSDFSNMYLDEYGRFTPNGESKYLDDIAGYISYLNREKDARQFAQPIVRFVTVPLIENIDILNKFDKKYVREHLDSDVVELKQQVNENLKKLEGDLSDLDMTKFNGLNTPCQSYEGKEKESCEKIVKKNIKLVLAEAKIEVKKIRDVIKSIREEIKNKNLYKNETLKGISENLEKNPEEYAKFKNSLYYNLKTKCGKIVRTSEDLKEAIKIHPVIVDLNQQIDEYDMRIRNLNEELKTNINVYKKRLLQIKEMMKTELSPLEKNVLRMVLRDERKNVNKITRRSKRENNKDIIELNKRRKNIEKGLKKKTVQLRKTLKKRLNEEEYYEKENKKAEKQIRKTMRKQGIIENIENEMLQELFIKYSSIINEELKNLKESMEQDEHEEQLKLQQKEEKKRVKEEEKKINAAAKEHEKAAKKAERERLRETKRAEKLAKKNKTVKKKS